MYWVIKTAKSAIGVLDPCPYLASWVGCHPNWTAKQANAETYPCRCRAFDVAKLWGPSWRDAVRVVRLVRRRK